MSSNRPCGVAALLNGHAAARPASRFFSRFGISIVGDSIAHSRATMRSRLWVIGLVLVTNAYAADLKPETIAAWNRYVDASDAAMQTRLQPGRSFLWIDEAPGRREKVQAGEILVSSVGAQNPKQVASGLIHHWIGAVFLPNATLDDVLGVVRDYAHYKDYYTPIVLDSHSIQQTPGADRFSMVMMNKAPFVKIAFESECESSYVQAGAGRWYSIAKAVRLQEIDNYGRPSERKLPSGEGSGYVWKLHTITRYEESDGGVYIELEAIALSRDIAASVRWMVDPIVRRISKGAIVTSLRQTMDAVCCSSEVAARHLSDTPKLSSGFLQSPRH